MGRCPYEADWRGQPNCLPGRRRGRRSAEAQRSASRSGVHVVDEAATERRQRRHRTRARARVVRDAVGRGGQAVDGREGRT